MAKHLPTNPERPELANRQPASSSPISPQQYPSQPQQLPLPGIIQQAMDWSGPYPPPDAVERYEAVLPGAFNRIITMAEQLQTAQVAQSKLALDYSSSNGRRGHWLGFMATILAMGGALLCAWCILERSGDGGR
jgi:uncharacterized membrane protein